MTGGTPIYGSPQIIFGSSFNHEIPGKPSSLVETFQYFHIFPMSRPISLVMGLATFTSSEFVIFWRVSKTGREMLRTGEGTKRIGESFSTSSPPSFGSTEISVGIFGRSRRMIFAKAMTAMVVDQSWPNNKNRRLGWSLYTTLISVYIGYTQWY